MNKKPTYLTLIDTTHIKCISIIIIVLHNFLHWTNPIKENEMSLDTTRIYNLFSHIADTPIGSFNYLLSYFGWYFITPFIFISSYGLTIKWQKNDTPLLEVITSALFKVIILLIVGCIYLFIAGYSLNEILEIFIRKTSTIDNLFIHTIFNQIGPWWYFSLAIQLYLLYPILLKIFNKYGFYLSIFFSYTVIYFLYYYIKPFNIFGTAIGHSPELILGIALAKKQFISLNNIKILIIYFITLLIFILSNIYIVFFPTTYLSFLILFLITFNYFKGRIKHKVLYTIGIISPFIFLLNGPIRQYTMSAVPYIKNNFSVDQSELILSTISIFHLFAVIILALLTFLISDKFTKYLHNKCMDLVKPQKK
ncbi:MAG: acyltransferase family protein [Wohlfahrtiimonas sp.]